MSETEYRPIEILLVEDSPSDTELTIEALRDAKMGNHPSTVEDGVQAMEFLRREGPYADAPRPDLIMLDLNLPGMDGREVLSELKADENLRAIPVVMLTASHVGKDLLGAYKLSVSRYIKKPVDLDQFMEVVKSIEAFWVCVARLPENHTKPPAPGAG